MATELRAVAECLRNWPTFEIPRDMSTAHLRRFGRCLSAVRDRPATVGWADLAALVRQVLRTGDRPVPHGGSSYRLTVPVEARGTPWPTRDQWRSCGVRSDSVDGHYQVTAEAWRPKWSKLDNPIDDRVSLAPFRMERQKNEVAADPFLKATFPLSSTDFSHYTSDAHQQAVRTVMSCQESATVIVNLPTGAGKSTVALAPALTRAQPAGVSVMIVPTVALALDQERRVRELLGGSTNAYAYTGSTPSPVRSEIRQAIRQGQQWIIFVSPEAVTRSLAPALFHAARQGYLRYFIIDEAHLVDQWGTEFRPEFQAMAGLRDELLACQRDAGHSGFRTLLMTATMRPSTVDLLVKLFGNPGPVETAIANVLRPEPAYFTAKFDDWRQRRSAVVEALQHLPRPAIVYSSRPAYAESIFEELLSAGFRRVGLFTGETLDSARSMILQEFRDGTLDIVCATSAFGLGVDQEDVRTVIHACVPETIDRYYQEVGRAGRDGRASISLLMWTDGDRKDAYSFSHSKVIGVELGIERWTQMLQDATHDERDTSRILIPLASLRASLESSSEANEKWNVRTLGLLARAGLIRPSWDVPLAEWQPVPIEDGEFSHNEESQVYAVRIVQGRVDDRVWERDVEPVRAGVKSQDDLAYQLIIDALEPAAPICELIRSGFDLGESSSLTAGQHHGAPTIACGGCPAHPGGRHTGVPPKMAPVNAPLIPEVDAPTAFLRTGSIGLVSYVTPQTRRDWDTFDSDLSDLLGQLVHGGLRVIAAPERVMRLPQLKQFVSDVHLQVPDRIFFVESRSEYPKNLLDWLPGLPTLVIAGPDQTLPKDWFLDIPGERPIVIMVPTGYADPEREDRRLTELRPQTRPLSSLTGREGY